MDETTGGNYSISLEYRTGYEKLKKVYVIMIMPFELFVENYRIYTIRIITYGDLRTLRCFLAALQLILLINERSSHSLQRELIHASIIISCCRLWLNC